jgi:hypothetical protein
MKTTIKKLTAGTFIAFLLLVGNVQAEGTELKASGLETIETSLQLENWMTSETIWKTNSISMVEFIQETETGMELENWMTSEKVWNENQLFKQETESMLVLENWMTSETTWDLKKANYETKLGIESWMLNNKAWN